MSATDVPLTLPDRASDWLNPILVKETRQALKSRQFVATFLLMLLASWMISVWGIVLAGPGAEFRAIGGSFFFAYYVVLATAVFIVVPISAFRSLLAERDLHTWEVLSITTLKPRQIVWGKLASAVLQIFIYYSAITPFIAFANLLKGVDVPTIAFVLIASLLASLVLSLAAITAGTFGVQKYWQMFLTLGVLAGLVTSVTSAISMVAYGLQFGFPFEDSEFWWVVAAVAVYAVAYCALLLQVAVAQLTFDADNRSTGVRAAASAIFWMTLVVLSLWLALNGSWGVPTLPIGDIDEMLQAVAVLGAVHLAVIGLFAVTEPDALSRRVRREIQNLGALRLLAVPLLPGGSRGFLYVLIHISALSAFVFAASVWFARGSETTWRFAAALWCYLVIYLGLGSAASRLLRSVSGNFRPPHARVAMVLLVVVGTIVPQLLHFFDAVYNTAIARNREVLFVTDPLSTLYWLVERRQIAVEGHQNANLVTFILAGAAILSLALNARALVAGVLDVTRPYVPATPATPREEQAQAATVVARQLG
ncbi:MAG: hypothetical protein ACT4QC_01050 [Planctomycetaceae bacterium]